MSDGSLVSDYPIVTCPICGEIANGTDFRVGVVPDNIAFPTLYNLKRK